MHQTEEQKILKIPVSIFESADTKEELEDWLMANDPEFIKEMERIKTDADVGKGLSLQEVAKKWNINL